MPGKSIGYWLDESDFVLGGADHEGGLVSEVGAHIFPRDWPAVYEESDVLRSMVRKKGPCAAKRVSVVPSLGDEHQELLAKLRPRWLQSFDTAEEVERLSGFTVVEGWAIYDIMDDVTGAAFLAERYWWNATSDSTWLDFSPRPENVSQLLLAETAAPRQSRKAKTLLTHKQSGLADHLLRRRFPTAVAEMARVEAARGMSTAPAALAAAAPMSQEELKAIVKRVELGIADPIYQMCGHAEHDQDLSEGLVRAGMCAALVQHLLPSQQKHLGVAIRLLAVLTFVAAARCCEEAATASVLASGGVERLVALLSHDVLDVVTHAALALGHICRRCSDAQSRAGSAGGVAQLLRILESGGRFSLASVYALWQLCVGQVENSQQVLSKGGSAALLRLFGQSGADAELQLHVAGLWVVLARAPGAQDVLGNAGVVEALCETLIAGRLAHAHLHISGALANLLEGHAPNRTRACAKAEIVDSLLNIVQSDDPAASNAACALASVLHDCDTWCMERARDRGAFAVLLRALPSLSCSRGAYAALAHLSRRLPDEGPPAVDGAVLAQLCACLQDDGERARAEALALVMNLAPHLPTKPRLIRAGVVKPLARLLDHPDEDLRRRATEALANLMDGHPETIAKVSMEVPDLAKRLVYLLHTEYNLAIQRASSRTLGLLASRQCEAVRKAGGIDPLLAVLKGSPCPEAALAVLNVAAAPAARRELLDLGAVEALGKLLFRGADDSFGEPLQQDAVQMASYAAGALANLTASSPEASRRALAAGAVAALSGLLAAGRSDVEANSWASATLGHVLSAPSAPSVPPRAAARAAAAAAAAAAGAPVRGAVDAGALEALAGLLSAQHASAHELAIFGLFVVSQSMEPAVREALLRSRGTVHALRAMVDRHGEVGALRDRACHLLKIAGAAGV